MSIFEYISVLSSIITGLGITQLLRGVVQIIHQPDDGKPYLVHLIWIASTYLLSVVWWWFQFVLADLERWSFATYSFVVAYAVTIYIMCAVLIPSQIQSYGNYKEFFFAKKNWFFGFIAGGPLLAESGYPTGINYNDRSHLGGRSFNPGLTLQNAHDRLKFLH